jgi:hypothetical protein
LSEAELDPAIAAIVRLTTHALWTNDLLLTNVISPELLRGIVARLEDVTYPAAGTHSNTAPVEASADREGVRSNH